MAKIHRSDFRVGHSSSVALDGSEVFDHYSIVVVNYDKKGDPFSYVLPADLTRHPTAKFIVLTDDSVEKLNYTIDRIKRAFLLPTIDLDDFPKEYHNHF